MTTHRTMCDALKGMRKLYETRNFSSLLGLIEEVQIMRDRMEASIYYGKSIAEQHDELKKIKKEYNKVYKIYEGVVDEYNQIKEEDQEKIEKIRKYHDYF